MTRAIGDVIESYIEMRRGLGYRSVTHERSLREFARYLDGHEGPIPLETTLEWATSTSSTNPRNPAQRLGRVRGLLRHLHAMDGTTDVPAPGLLGPTGHRTPPHVYSDAEIAALLAEAARLDPPGGLRPRCYVTLFGLLACTGLRISEALALSCADVDLHGALITVRAGKRGLTRLVPLHPSAVAALADYVAERERRYSAPGPGDGLLPHRGERADQLQRRPSCLLRGAPPAGLDRRWPDPCPSGARSAPSHGGAPHRGLARPGRRRGRQDPRAGHLRGPRRGA